MDEVPTGSTPITMHDGLHDIQFPDSPPHRRNGAAVVHDSVVEEFGYLAHDDDDDSGGSGITYPFPSAKRKNESNDINTETAFRPGDGSSLEAFPSRDDDDDGGHYRQLRWRQRRSRSDSIEQELPTNTGDLLRYSAARNRKKQRSVVGGIHWREYAGEIQYFLKRWCFAVWHRGMRVAERVLPEWFTEVPIEEVSSEWQGRRWLSETWRATRRPLAYTTLATVMIIALWWIFIPFIAPGGGFGSSSSSNTLFKTSHSYLDATVNYVTGDRSTKGNTNARDSRYPSSSDPTPGSYRVDAMGKPIHDPMPLCDLLYSRREHATHRDEIAAELSRRIAAVVTNTPEREVDDGVRLFHTNVPDHRVGARWDHLMDHEAVRPELPRVIEPLPIALNKLSEAYQEAILNRKSPDSMGISISRAKSLFQSTTVSWLRRECSNHPSPARYALRDAQGVVGEVISGSTSGHQSPQGESFAMQVAETGSFTVNTTGYIAPTLSRDSVSGHGNEKGRDGSLEATNDASHGDAIGVVGDSPDSKVLRERDRAISEMLDIYSEEEEEEEEEKEEEDNRGFWDGSILIDSTTTETWGDTRGKIIVDSSSTATDTSNAESGAKQQIPPLLMPHAEGSTSRIEETPENHRFALRNVSAYELHVMMYHMAAQAKEIWMTERTHIDRSIQIAAETIAGLTGAAGSSPPNPWNRVGQRKGNGDDIATDEDALTLLAHKQVAALNRKADQRMSEFRSRVLWAGETGCVCPHHIGVPIPGAAWTESLLSRSSSSSSAGTRDSNSKRKTRVLFYPRLPEWIYHCGGAAAQPPSHSQQFGDKGGHTGRDTTSDVVQQALSWFETLSSNWIAPNPVGRSGFFKTPGQSSSSSSSSVMAVGATDPVFGDIYVSESDTKRTGYDESSQCSIHKIPYDPEDPWTWVEGLDFRGQRQRLRVSPISLSCILSCSQSCSEVVVVAN